eukprot:403349835
MRILLYPQLRSSKNSQLTVNQTNNYSYLYSKLTKIINRLNYKIFHQSLVEIFYRASKNMDKTIFKAKISRVETLDPSSILQTRDDEKMQKDQSDGGSQIKDSLEDNEPPKYDIQGFMDRSEPNNMDEQLPEIKPKGKRSKKTTPTKTPRKTPAKTPKNTPSQTPTKTPRKKRSAESKERIKLEKLENKPKVKRGRKPKPKEETRSQEENKEDKVDIFADLPKCKPQQSKDPQQDNQANKFGNECNQQESSNDYDQEEDANMSTSQANDVLFDNSVYSSSIVAKQPVIPIKMIQTANQPKLTKPIDYSDKLFDNPMQYNDDDQDDPNLLQDQDQEMHYDEDEEEDSEK